MAEASATSGADRAVRVVLPEADWEAVGAILMDRLGPFEQQECPVLDGSAGRMVALVFYPDSLGPPGGDPQALQAEILAVLPPALRSSGRVRLETREVPRDWVDGWRDHFRPVVVGAVRIRPPWMVRQGTAGRRPRKPQPEAAGPVQAGAAAADSAGPTARAAAAPAGRCAPSVQAPVDVVINPGLGFGTGMHPTTRGVLRLLQQGALRPSGPLVDAGTGSGVLAVAAAKLGWGPVVAFDNDPLALQSAEENTWLNGVERIVRLQAADIADVPPEWFGDATVLAHMTLEPVTALVKKLAVTLSPMTAPAAPPSAAPLGVRDGGRVPTGPRRLVVSGILAGEQERALLTTARQCGFAPGGRVLEAGWVSLELLPSPSPGT